MERALNAVARALAGLARHRFATAALAFVYAATTIALHERVNELVRGLQQALGPVPFLRLAAGLGAAAAAALAVAIARVDSGGGSFGGRRGRLVAGFALWLAAVALAWRYLFTVASEAVHFPQYALLTLLLFPLVGRIGGAMLAANLVGIVDEANQYWNLHADWGIYLDWNDIVLNALGAALGGLLLALAAAGSASARRTSRAPAWPFRLTAALLVAGTLLVAAGKIALHAGPDRRRAASAWLLLDRGDTRAQPFWITAEWAQKRFHVLQPAPGALLVALFAALGWAVDRPRRGERAP